ncbi:hypothetical protein HSBAA_29960 [Vreelandella sulfidaeris]|uniref:Uncharacterized protein n=1 Tax=Vreelandella sulfidaeris TaxID=115553 RepID=A0A455U6A3_9GAMM|nr:hypothetical protein HSBAA_29960 [Halomonas sulfidaeris]
MIFTTKPNRIRSGKVLPLHARWKADWRGGDGLSKAAVGASSPHVPEDQTYRGTKLTNTARGKFVNDLFAIVNRSVVDTLYRGVGVSYRMINLAARMHPRQIIEIQSAMSKFSPLP